MYKGNYTGFVGGLQKEPFTSNFNLQWRCTIKIVVPPIAG